MEVQNVKQGKTFPQPLNIFEMSGETQYYLEKYFSKQKRLTVWLVKSKQYFFYFQI